MPLLPSNVKWRKQHVRSFHYDHVATRCNTVAFGEFAIQATEGGEITARQIEAARVTASRHLGRNGKMWIRIFPQTPVTARPADTRMGKGKGNVEYWCARVQPGTVLFEISGLSEDLAREALRRQAHKLPVKTRMVKRRD